ncbi:anoctamin-4-like isoform X2 [Symsagittifera roscoffensis]|uniref:anoctamin-4-like isoform X2 n=1 Tax=Symsagittifera roscoffensis TaxID=84072 RepID=UPI00307BDE29
MANIGWNVPGRSVEEGADNPVYVMGYEENQPLPPISPNLHTVSPSSVGTSYPNGETSLPYPTFPSDSDHDSTTGPNPSAQPLLHSPPSPPHSQVNPAVNLEMTTPSAPHATPHAHDAVHEDDVVAPTKEVKMYAPVKPEEMGIESQVTGRNLKFIPQVPDEELKACFTTFPGADEIPKRIDFVLVHQVSDEESSVEKSSKKEDKGNGGSKKDAEAGENGHGKGKDDHFTHRESREFFTNNLLAKGLLLKEVKCGEDDSDSIAESAPKQQSPEKKLPPKDFAKAKQKTNYAGLKAVTVSRLAKYVESREKESDLVFTLCHAPDDLLLKWCEILRMKMPLQQCDSEVQKNFLGKLWEKVPNTFEPFEFKQTIPDSQDPYSYFTAVFTEARQDRFALEKMGGTEHFFTVGDRNRIVYSILSRTEYDCDEDREKDGQESESQFLNKKFGIDRMIDEQIYNSAYPLHSGNYLWDPIEMGMPWHECEYLTDRQKLFYSWADWRTFYKKQPMTLIRRYFGEKIGIYFAWLGFYTWFLFPAAALGFICFLYGCLTMATDDISREVCDDGPAANYTMCPLCDKACEFWKLGESCIQVKVSRMIDNEATIVFALFMSLWGILFLEFWKRTKNELAYEWDLFDYEEGTQTIRPQFERKAMLVVAKNAKKKDSWWQINPVTLMTEPFMPLTTRLPKLCASISIVFFMISVVLATVIGVVIYRALAGYFFVKQDLGPTWSSILTSCTASTVNLMFIFAFSRFYNVLAYKLTEFECPRTDSEFDNSYTVKMFVFQFVNYYSSIFYIAFFKGRFGGYPTNYSLVLDKYRLQECGPGGCLFDLMTQLGTIMVGKQLYSNLQEIGMPMLKKWFASRKFRNQQEDEEDVDGEGGNKENDEKKLHRWEKDFVLSAWPPMNLFYEYLEMVIQFGFTTLFVAAFPLAPFFAFLNNVIEIKLDAYKFITQLRRPWAQKAEDIGSWYNILSAIAVIAVLTNGLIISFTSSFVDRFYYNHFVDSSSLPYFEFTTALSRVYDHKTDTNITCRYQGFRYDYNDPKNTPYQHTPEFYELMALRLGFVLLFENIVFALRSMVAYMVPDMPVHVRVEKAREEYLTRQVLYESEKPAAKKVVSKWLSKTSQPPHFRLPMMDRFNKSESTASSPAQHKNDTSDTNFSSPDSNLHPHYGFSHHSSYNEPELRWNNDQSTV